MHVFPSSSLDHHATTKYQLYPPYAKICVYSRPINADMWIPYIYIPLLAYKECKWILNEYPTIFSFPIFIEMGKQNPGCGNNIYIKTSSATPNQNPVKVNENQA